MGLRAVTQKPIQYFTEHQKEIEKFLELEDPSRTGMGRAYQSSDYRALVNLMTHVGDIDSDVAIKNSVLSVFFLRFLKKAGYFRSGIYRVKTNCSLTFITLCSKYKARKESDTQQSGDFHSQTYSSGDKVQHSSTFAISK